MIKRHNAKDDVMQLIFLLKKLKITKKNILNLKRFYKKKLI